MSLVNLSKRTTGVGFEYTETIADGANGNTVLIPGISGRDNITCSLIAGANTGKFQFTTSPDANISAGTETWQDWPLGAKTGTISDLLLGPVMTIRGVSISGEVKIEVVL